MTYAMPCAVTGCPGRAGPVVPPCVHDGRDVRLETVALLPMQGDAAIPAGAGPVLVRVVAGTGVVERRLADGGWDAYPVRAGDVCLVDAPARWRAADGECVVMQMRVGAALLARAAPAGIVLRGAWGERDEILCGLLDVLAATRERGTDPDGRFARGIAQALAAHLARHYGAAVPEPGAMRGGLPARKLERIVGAMRARLGEPFDLRTLAAEAGLSMFHFSRVFKQATGMSPGRYVVRLRMEEAQRLLRTTPASILDIALTLGYRSPSHFSLVFRRHAGVAPSAYRNGAPADRVR